MDIRELIQSLPSRLRKKYFPRRSLTSAAKAAIDFAALTARLKPRPFKTKSKPEFFRSLLEREKAEIGVLISMEPPTKPMLKESAEPGFYKSPHLDDSFSRMQLLTIEELLQGKQVAYPRWVDATFKKAPRAKEEPEDLDGLPF